MPMELLYIMMIAPGMYHQHRHVASGGAGGAAAPPDFGRSEGVAGQRRRPTVLPAPPDF